LTTRNGLTRLLSKNEGSVVASVKISVEFGTAYYVKVGINVIYYIIQTQQTIKIIRAYIKSYYLFSFFDKYM